MTHPLAGRVALVTGAGRRLGRAMAVALGGERLRVAVHYRASLAEAEATCAFIRDVGGEAAPFAADLTDAHAVGPLIDEVVDHFGALDVLVNSAAVMMRTPIESATVEQWDAMFALNVRAPFFLAQAAARVMAGRVGCIVNIADLAAFETWPAYVPHGISKAGVVQMTRGLARALAPGIRVNAIAPGAVLLPEQWDEAQAEHLRATTPLRRLGSPADVVDALLYLVRAEYVTGETIVVDGGRRVRM